MHRLRPWAALVAPLIAIAVACTAPSAPRPTAPRPTVPDALAPVPVDPSAGYPGWVPEGAVRWGAAIEGNGDPIRHEAATDRSLGVRRTYYQWSNRTGSVLTTARADVAAGRLPWISVKTPGWAAMASGQLDGEIDELLRGLDSVGGPVWLTVHHEPEGGGGVGSADDPAGPAAWRAMQVRVRERMQALGTRDVGFLPVLMAWTFDPRSGRDPDEWFVPGVWDLAAVDYYVDSVAPADIATAGRQWLAARDFYGRRGLDMALGEWGNRGTDLQAAAEMLAFYAHAVESASDGLGARVVALAYFDSNLNSTTGGWELTGEPLRAFRELVDAPTSFSSGPRSSGPRTS